MKKEDLQLLSTPMYKMGLNLKHRHFLSTTEVYLPQALMILEKVNVFNGFILYVELESDLVSS